MGAARRAAADEKHAPERSRRFSGHELITEALDRATLKD
jgi:hypothetical protein